MCRIPGIRKTRTTALHPQSDGMVERMNRTMGKYLSKVVADHQRDWDQYLHFFMLAYRSSVHETTGETPANVLFGRELLLPCDLQFGCKPDEDLAGEDYVSRLKERMDDIHNRVRDHIQRASERMKIRYDVKADKGGYQPGDLVWLYNPRRRQGFSPKLQKAWEGPYEIVTRINDLIYRIKKPPNGKPRIVHINRLAPFKGDNGPAREQNLRACKPQGVSFDEFMATIASGISVSHGVTRTAQQDLFTAPPEYALAHCVAQDLKMSRGIARVFKSKYGDLRDQEHQNISVGDAVHLFRGDRNLFYLVTKKQSHEKPTYNTIWESLINLRQHLIRLGISRLAIPKLACGLDRLNWWVVRSMIEELFKGTGIDILVCFFDPRNSSRNEEDTFSPCGRHGLLRRVDEFSAPRLKFPVLGQNSLKEGVV